MSKTIYRSIAAAAVLTLSVSGTAGIALAETTPGNINADTPVSLTIHKYETGGITPAAGKADGSVQINGTGIDGVVFKAHRLDLDLTKPADWAKLYDGNTAKTPATDVCNDSGDLANAQGDILPSVSQATDNENVKATVEGKTANGGTLVLSEKMKVGAYLICEGDTTDAMKGAEKVKVRTKAKPFIVTLPLPTGGDAAAPENTTWNYTPHVYPKNELSALPTKEMDVPANAVTGAENAVTITITSRIPTLATGTFFNYFALEDTMVKELKPANSDYTFEVETGQTYTVGDDYSVYTKYDGNDSSIIRVGLTRKGLDKLAQDAGKTVTFKFKVTMTGYPANGKFINKSKSYIKTGEESEPTPPTPENPPTPDIPPSESDDIVASTWGKLRAIKLDAKNQAKHLEGAEFKLWAFPVTDDIAEKCEQGATLAKKAGATQVMNATGGELILRSNAQGIIEQDALHIDTKKATLPTQPAPATKRCFYLEEITAPAGYTLPAGDAVLTPVVVNSEVADPDATAVKINNTPHSVPDLPLTGANGQLLMSIIGGALMLGSFGTYLVVRRRRAEQA